MHSEKNISLKQFQTKESGYGHDRQVSSTRPLRSVKISFFLSVMPPKDLAPFSYISPQKTFFQR